MKRRSILLVLLAVALCVPTVAFGEINANITSYSAEFAAIYDRLDELQAQVNKGGKDFGKGPNYAMLETDGCSGWIANVDVLYWTARNVGFEYGITDIGGVQDRGAVGQVLEIGGDYQAGFRLGVGKRLRGGAEFGVMYTNFSAGERETFAGPLRATIVSADNSENDDSDNINTLGVETVTPDDRATSADALQRIDYGVFDLTLAQNLIVSENLTLRFVGGGRYADIDQRKQVTYRGGDFQTLFTSFQNSRYSGGGIITGLESRWYLRSNLSLNFGLTGGLMMGEMNTRTFIPDDEPGVPTDVSYSQTRLTPLMEALVGFDYVLPFDRVAVTVSGGYQFVHWFNLVDDREFFESHQEGTNAHIVGDLSLDGFYGRIGFNW